MPSTPADERSLSLLAGMVARDDVFPGLSGRLSDLVAAEIRGRLLDPAGDLAALRALHDALGPEEAAAAVAALKAPDLGKAMTRLDLLYGKEGGAERLLLLAEGKVEPRRAMVVETMDLETLRTHGSEDAEGLASVLGKATRQAVADLLGRVDPGFVVPSRGEPERLVARAMDLANGAQPRPNVSQATDVASLRAFREGLEREEFAELVDGLPAKAADEFLTRLDPEFPTVGRTASAKGRLVALAEGAEPAPALDDATVDLAALREAGARSGRTFALAWARAMPNPQAKALARRLDPERPDVKSLNASELVEAIAGLAMGEPTMAEREAAPSIDGITAFEAAYGEGGSPYLREAGGGEGDA